MSEDTNADLNKLLDDALGDFDKYKKAAAKESEESNNSLKAKDEGEAGNSNTFFLEQTKLLAERMNAMYTANNENNKEHMMGDHLLQQMAEAAAATMQGENATKEADKCSDGIAEALKGFQKGIDMLSSPVPENIVANMLSGLNLEGPSEEEGNIFLPFMEGMMQNLLSAEILLPIIEELLAKYPKYLSDNADTLTSEEKERYDKQFELYKTIANHLKAEKADDAPPVKREKFKMILEDMRKLHEYGQPPSEIMAETASNLPGLDSSTTTMDPQCPTM